MQLVRYVSKRAPMDDADGGGLLRPSVAFGLLQSLSNPVLTMSLKMPRTRVREGIRKIPRMSSRVPSLLSFFLLCMLRYASDSKSDPAP